MSKLFMRAFWLFFAFHLEVSALIANECTNLTAALAQLTSQNKPFEKKADQLVNVFKHLYEAQRLTAEQLKTVAESPSPLNPLSLNSDHSPANLLPFRSFIDELLKDPSLDWQRVRAFAQERLVEMSSADRHRQDSLKKTKLSFTPVEIPTDDFHTGTNFWTLDSRTSDDFDFMMANFTELKRIKIHDDGHLEVLGVREFSEPVYHVPRRVQFLGKDFIAVSTLDDDYKRAIEIREDSPEASHRPPFAKIATEYLDNPFFDVTSTDRQIFIVQTHETLSGSPETKFRPMHIFVLDEFGKQIGASLIFADLTRTRWIADKNRLLISNVEIRRSGFGRGFRFASLVEIKMKSKKMKVSAIDQGPIESSAFIPAEPPILLNVALQAFHIRGDRTHPLPAALDSGPMFQVTPGLPFVDSKQNHILPLLTRAEENSAFHLNVAIFDSKGTWQLVSTHKDLNVDFEFNGDHVPSRIVWRDGILIAATTLRSKVEIFYLEGSQLNWIASLKIQDVSEVYFAQRNKIPYLIAAGSGRDLVLFRLETSTPSNDSGGAPK